MGPLLGVVGFILIITGWLMVEKAAQGLETRFYKRDGVPIRLILPENLTGIPGVIIAHGFSGSQQLMLGYGYSLAQAGYGVALLDFAGHGGNANQLSLEDGSQLLGEIGKAFEVLLEQREIDPEKIGLLGHSMGSGAVMQAGFEYPERYRAVVAVSPTNAEVTEKRPSNLLLQAGALEGRFVANAEDLLARAGGIQDGFDIGTARNLAIVPGVEHITILFNTTSHQLSLDWFNQAFSHESEQQYFDNRIVWYGVHLLGWILVMIFAGGFIRDLPSRQGYKNWHAIWGLLFAPFLGSGLLWLINQMIDLREFGGFLVGGTLGVWFFLMGAGWIMLNRCWEKPSHRGIFLGFLLFGFLWMGFGWMAQTVWLPWYINLPRLIRWPLMSAACFPWQLAACTIQVGQTRRVRFGWWLGQTFVIIAGLVVAMNLVPGLGFILLIIPALPLVIGLLAFGVGVIKDPWAGALGNALFFGWLIVVLFPLV